MKSARPSYPRVNCVIQGCHRGTTRCAPNDDGSAPEIICGNHFRKLPKSWRRKLTLYRRAFDAAERREDVPKMRAASRCWWSRWEACKHFLNEPESIMDDGLPLGLSSELKKDGLI